MIRGSISCELPNSLRRQSSTSKILLTYHLLFAWSKSQESWNLQAIKIHTSMPSLTWHSVDKYNSQTGLTLSLTRNHNNNQWCDYCKGRWGQGKNGEWHPKARIPAVWVCTSEAPYRKGRKRFYCQSCALEVQNWPTDDVTKSVFWSLKEQLDYAIGQGELDV